jgi:hypothetical protein
MRRKILSFKSDPVLNAVKKVFNVLLVFFYLRVFVFAVNLFLIRIFEGTLLHYLQIKITVGSLKFPQQSSWSSVVP